MKANELRIGNYIKTHNGLNIVVPSLFSCTEYLESDAEPIPLTEEWLLKFGFSKDDDDYFSIKVKEYGYELLVLICGDCFDLSVYDGDGNPLTIANIKYVHQLQNLYFALTNEELTLSQK